MTSNGGRGTVAPFIVMDLLRAANEYAALGRRIIHLEIGQPSTSAPHAVLNEAHRALRTNHLGYTDCGGMPALRHVIAAHYRATHGVEISEGDVFITTGSSAGFLLAFLAAFKPGDRVALAAPSYPAYRNILMALGFEPVLIPVDSSSCYQLNAALLSLHKGIRGVIVASPSNPTGSMIDSGTFNALYQWCLDNGARLISDEIYHGITYVAPAQTARAFGRDAIIINSFSKYFSMTGWRLGWMVLPEELKRLVECLAQNLHISPPTLSQIAAIKAFGCRDELDGHVNRYRRNRDILLRALPRAGISVFAPPDGAFYLYADISHLMNDSLGFCYRLLAETGVAIAPGIDFDPINGAKNIRISFAGATNELEEGTERFLNWASQFS